MGIGGVINRPKGQANSPSPFLLAVLKSWHIMGDEIWKDIPGYCRDISS